MNIINTQNKKIIDKEIIWDKTKIIISKTDVYGTILYANDEFIRTSKYSKSELIGKPQNIIRHPDMPKVTFSLLWESLRKGENFHVIIKNLTKSGYYYWVITDFTMDKDENDTITGYTARRKAVPQGVIKKIEPIYKTLLEIERQEGEKASELYFDTFLTEKIGKNYNDFVVDLFENERTKEANKYKKTPLTKTLSWFFLTDYEEYIE